MAHFVLLCFFVFLRWLSRANLCDTSSLGNPGQLSTLFSLCSREVSLGAGPSFAAGKVGTPFCRDSQRNKDNGTGRLKKRALVIDRRTCLRLTEKKITHAIVD